ncbi:MAG TPA: VWA domain-containing protein [Solirubrobacteraceae bacterium]|nr:VWA domain-containing protein [Solirubrobacteraceae bacterium]
MSLREDAAPGHAPAVAAAQLGTGGADRDSAGNAVAARIGALAAEMRRRGSRVGMGELLTAIRALDHIDASEREQVRLALSVVLCCEHRDFERFTQAFSAVFGDGIVDPPHDPGEDIAALGQVPQEVLPQAGAADPSGPEAAPDAEPVPAAWSDIEVLVRKDFARYTPAESALARELIARLARRHPMRLSRRTRLSRRRGHAPDLRATVQASLRTAGEPLVRRWRAPTERPRQLVLVCDVSGSMTPYARMLLQYMQASVAARRRVEAFAFGTRLTRITQELAGRDPDLALARATEAVTDFSGGTRIGAALAVLNRVHGRRLGRGAVVVVLSDGWDRGEPEQLRGEMARLRRAAHRVIWLNPLAAHPDYEPLTRGMQAAVPHTDRLLAGNSIASLEELAEVLEAL